MAKFAEMLEDICCGLAAAKRLAKSMAKSWPDDKTMRINREMLADAKQLISEIDGIVNPQLKKKNKKEG